MATLENQSVASTFTYLLKMDGTSGVPGDSSLVKVQDGDATQSALSLGRNAIAIDATDKLHLDGGGDTYFHEASSDLVEWFAGGTKRITMNHANSVFMVHGDTNSEAVIKVDPSQNNGVILLSDDYNTGNQSQLNLGITYSGGNSYLASKVYASSTNVITDADGWLSSQNISVARGSAVVADGIEGEIQCWVGETSSSVAPGLTRTLTQAMTVKRDGKVGIGTTAPARQLHVVGDVQVGIDNTGHDVKFFGATSGSFMLWDESDDALELTDSTPLKIGDDGDMTIYHNGSHSFITNATGTMKLATETTDIAVSIGHTSSVTTINDELDVTGTVDINDTTESTSTTTGALKVDGGVGIVKDLFVGYDLDVDGVANLDNTDIDGTFTMDGSTFDVNATTTCAIDNTNTSNGDTIGTNVSGMAITLGHGTSEVTVGQNLTVTGNSTITSGDLIISNGAKGIVHTGSGTVTQATNHTGGVEINKTSGVIQLAAVALNAATNAEFTVTNSTVDSDSIILVSMQDENTTDNAQLTCATHTIGSGSFKITLHNPAATGATSATASKIHFLVINK